MERAKAPPAHEREKTVTTPTNNPQAKNEPAMETLEDLEEEMFERALSFGHQMLVNVCRRPSDDP
jgi:hypothetical protein